MSSPSTTAQHQAETKPDDSSHTKLVQTCAVTLWSVANNSRESLTNRHVQCINAILKLMKGFYCDPSTSHASIAQIVPLLDSSHCLPEEGYLTNHHLAGLQVVLDNLEKCLADLEPLPTIRKKPEKQSIINQIHNTKKILQNDLCKVTAATRRRGCIKHKTR